MSQQPLRVLHVIGAMDRGGAETLVMNLYRHVNRGEIQFDFLVNEYHNCDYDDEITQLGGKIFRIPRYRIANYCQYKRACSDFFSNHTYKIVHGHIALPSAIYLKEAHKAGAFCIAHSHAQNFPLSPSELAFRICSYPTRNHADYFLACSEQAGIDRYGSGVCRTPFFHVLNNGIDVESSRYSPANRSSIRSELGIAENAPVFGHVGRLTPVKNHDFLLEVFSSILGELPDAQLILAGRGEEETRLKHKADILGIANKVHFLGIRNDVPAILSAIDVFVFPSIKEGLANAVIEAQASGARCLVSTGVPELAKISTQTVFASLESDGVEGWSKLAIDLYRNPIENRSSCADNARLMGFDIQDSADWLSNLYLAAAASEFSLNRHS